MRLPKHWAVLVAGCAIAAIGAEGMLVLYEPRPRTATAPRTATTVAEAESLHCATLPPSHEAAAPTATQPGGIDPLGLSGAIRRALDDCP